MAYDHGRYSVQFQATGAGSLTSGAILVSAASGKSRWAPGYQPHVIRAVWVMPLSTKAKVTKPIIDFRLTTGNVASVSTNNFARMTLVSTGSAKGVIFYRDGLNTEVKPGDFVTVAVKTAATVAYPCTAGIYVEARWDKPANFTRMTSVTG